MGKNEDLQASIVIIGGGSAGLAAAVAAAETGAKDITVIEVRKTIGGNGNFVLGCMGIESPLQKYLGIICRKDDVFKGLMSYSHWKGDPTIVRALVDKTATLYQWLEEKGVEWGGIYSHFPGQSPRAHHYTKGTGSTGSTIVRALRKSCEDHGVRIITETRAKKLLTNEKGDVIGVIAESKDKELKINAECVIIGTGGIQGNSELIAKHVPDYKPEDVLGWGLPHMADGVLMAEEIGAAREGRVELGGHGPIFVGRRNLNTICVAYDPSTLWVNKLGKRFANENIVWLFTEAANAVLRQPGKMCYSIFDESTRQRILKEEFTEFYEAAARLMAGAPKDIRADWQDTADANYKEEAKLGNLTITDSLEEIARFIESDPEVLKSTINLYNSFCDKGHDDLFAKDIEFLRPVRTPPYYAMRCRVAINHMWGDLKVDEHMRVLKKATQTPIGGLYAAGDDIHYQDGDTYNVNLTGHAFGFALSGGRIAGENAAKSLSGKSIKEVAR